MPLHKAFFIFLLILLAHFSAGAQYTVRGTVYDSSRTYPLEAVSVLTTKGYGTITNAAGAYSIEVGEKDSIWFSYLGKPTIKFPVKNITDFNQFDLSLRVPISLLKEVRIRPRDYRMDSIQNRRDYEKAFEFRRPNVESMTSIGPGGAGIDINELIRLFQFRRNNATLRFQNRLLLQEQERFIDYRFNKALVRRLTGLDGTALDLFMAAYRPTYEFVLYTSEYEFQVFIKESVAEFNKYRAF